MTIIQKRVLLPLLAVDRLWAWAELGDVHPTLGIGDFWVAEEARPQVEDAVYEVLGQEGLGTRDNPPPEIIGTLRLIATATEEYYAWIDDIADGDAGALLVAAKDDEAVVMGRDQRGMVLEPVGAEDLAERFVDSLTKVEAADIPNLTVPKAAFDATPTEEVGDDEDAFDFAYAPDQPDEVDPTAKLRELMQAKRAMIYQIYAARRSDDGLRKTAGPYSALDIVAQGRVLAFETTAEGGEPTIKCLPGSRENLVKALTEANEALG